MVLRDLLERTAWTALSAALGAIPAAQLSAAIWDLDVSGLQTIGASVVSAVMIAIVNGLTVIARYRLSVLPDPGDGLPGLPVYDGGPDDDPVVGEDLEDWEINEAVTVLDGGKGLTPIDADPKD